MEGKFVELEVISDPYLVSVVRAAAGAVARECGFRGNDIWDIQLAVNEAYANIIEHAYRGNTNRKIILKYCIFDDRLQIIIRDFAEKVDPSTFKSRDLNDPSNGGLGVFLINAIMDKVYYNTDLPLGTELHLTKYRKGVELGKREIG
ncbi:MAG: ATP-binding protein [bacterium]